MLHLDKQLIVKNAINSHHSLNRCWLKLIGILIPASGLRLDMANSCSTAHISNNYNNFVRKNEKEKKELKRQKKKKLSHFLYHAMDLALLFQHQVSYIDTI